MATPKKKHPKKAGRKTLYRPEYCSQLIDFFSEEPNSERDLEYTDQKTGEVKQKVMIVPNRLPFFSAFARKIKVDTSTLKEWRDVHPEFSKAYNKAKELQKEFLIENGINGYYNAPFAIFTAKNITDMRDKVETVMSGGLEIVRAELPAKKPIGSGCDFGD